MRIAVFAPICFEVQENGNSNDRIKYFLDENVNDVYETHYISVQKCE